MAVMTTLATIGAAVTAGTVGATTAAGGASMLAAGIGAATIGTAAYGAYKMLGGSGQQSGQLALPAPPKADDSMKQAQALADKEKRRLQYARARQESTLTGSQGVLNEEISQQTLLGS